MIDPVIARQIIEQYKRHGWVLRRVLFSEPLSSELTILMSGVRAVPGRMDAFWFSRRSLPDCEAWELRRMSGAPFALVEVIDDGTAEDDFEQILGSVEDRMVSAEKPSSSH